MKFKSLKGSCFPKAWSLSASRGSCSLTSQPSPLLRPTEGMDVLFRVFLFLGNIYSPALYCLR